MAEDRDLFNEMMEKLEIPMPESGMAVNVDEALEIAQRIGYPLVSKTFIRIRWSWYGSCL